MGIAEQAQFLTARQGRQFHPVPPAALLEGEAVPLRGPVGVGGLRALGCRTSGLLARARVRAAGGELIQQRGEFFLHLDHGSGLAQLTAESRDLTLQAGDLPLPRVGPRERPAGSRAPPARRRPLLPPRGDQRRVQALPPEQGALALLVQALVLGQDSLLVRRTETCVTDRGSTCGSGAPRSLLPARNGDTGGGRAEGPIPSEGFLPVDGGRAADVQQPDRGGEFNRSVVSGRAAIDIEGER